MNTHARVLAVAAALAASGCSLMVDPEANDPLADVQSYCNSVQDAFVAAINRCEAVDPAYVEAVISEWRVGCENLGDLSSHFEYDRAIAEQCISMLEGITCSGDGVFDALWGFCPQAIRGKVPAGGACSVTQGMIRECAGGGSCWVDNACPGTCVQPGLQDQPCAPAGQSCAAGLVCDGNNVCRVPGSQGANCEYPYPPCNSNYYYCSTAIAPWTCQSLPFLGQRCDDKGYACYPGYNCIYNPPDGLSYCRSPAPVGGDCSYNYCVSSAYCRYDAGTYSCRAIPTVPQGVGGDCYWNYDDDCQDGLYCDYSSGYLCQPLLGLGASCTDDNQCGERRLCSRLPTEPNGVCAQYKAKGSPCRVGVRECVDGLWCDGNYPGATGVCKSYGGAGAFCGHPHYDGNYYERADCATGYFCNDGGAWTGTCQRYARVGESCAAGYGDQCGYFSGNYCDGATLTCQPRVCDPLVGWFPGGEN